MNVLFIYPQPLVKKQIRFGFSLNIAYSSAILKKEGHKVFFIDCSCTDLNNQDIIQYIKHNNIRMVFVEFDSFALKRSLNKSRGVDILRTIKKYDRSINTAVFGFQCMMEKSYVEYADIVIKEDILGCILSAVENQGQTYTYENYEFDSLPFPDRDTIESVEYYRKNKAYSLIQTAKGCLNSCSFCQRRGWQNQYLTHSNEYSLQEFELLQSRQYRNIWISDENFTFNLSRAKQLLGLIVDNSLSANMKLAISSWTKIDCEFLELAAAANIKIISMGIESANPEILKFYNKDIDLNHVRELVKYANQVGVFMVGNFIIGAPMETKEMINNTFKYIEEVGFDQVNIKVLDYMIGSKLYETLPNGYNEDHYFSCVETGLGLFKLDVLKSLKNNFLENYYRSHSANLREKIIKFGTPYDIIVR